MQKEKIIKLKSFKKKGGLLFALDFQKTFPFKTKRIFYIYGRKKLIRGDHAQKKCKQIFIPISGTIELRIKNHKRKKKIILSKKNIAVMVPNLTWCRLKFKNNKSIVMVVCDRKYEYNDYIEKYSDLLKILKK